MTFRWPNERAWLGHGITAGARGREQFERNLALAREIGHREGEATASGNLGFVFYLQGDYGQARTQTENGLALAREIGNRRNEGYALALLASVAQSQGDIEEARRLFSEALALRRGLAEKGNVAGTLAALGEVELEQGDLDSATQYLQEALVLAREVAEPTIVLAATVGRARLPGGDIEAALAALAEYENRVPHRRRLQTRFHLWELTQDKTHLAEAKRLLDFAVAHSPEEYRTSMLENVPLHRDIMRAWEEHGGT